MKTYSVAQKSREVSVDKLLNKRRWIMPTGWIKENLSTLVSQILNGVQKQKKLDEMSQKPVERDHLPGLGAFAGSVEQTTITSSDKNTLGRTAHAFIQFSLEDGETSATDAIVSLANMQKNLQELQKKVSSEHASAAEISESVNASLQNVSGDLADAVGALQFYDRVAQRLAHSLACLQILHGADLQLGNEDEQGRKALLEVFYQHLSMEDERAMFNAIQAGGSIRRAVEMAHKRLDEEKKANSIHIF